MNTMSTPRMKDYSQREPYEQRRALRTFLRGRELHIVDGAAGKCALHVEITGDRIDYDRAATELHAWRRNIPPDEPAPVRVGRRLFVGKPCVYRLGDYVEFVDRTNLHRPLDDTHVLHAESITLLNHVLFHKTRTALMRERIWIMCSRNTRVANAKMARIAAAVRVRYVAGAAKTSARFVSGGDASGKAEHSVVRLETDSSSTDMLQAILAIAKRHPVHIRASVAAPGLRGMHQLDKAATRCFDLSRTDTA